MTKRKRFMWPAVIGLSFTLMACGPDRSGVLEQLQPEPATEENKPDSLRVWVHDTETYLQAYKVIAEQFTEETGIEVQLVPFGLFDQLEAMSLDAPSGRGPDLFFQPHDMTGNAYLQGVAAEIELTDEQKEGYIDGSLDALSYNGVQVGIPASVETYALMYNTDLIPEAPETIEELEQIGEDLTDSSSDQYGFLLEAQNAFFAYPFLAAYGGYFFGEDQGVYDVDDLGISNQGTVQGTELIRSWYEKGYLPSNLNGDIMNGLFLQGNVGAVVSGPWSINEYRNALGDNLRTAPLPKINGDRLESFAGVKGWMVNEYSEHINWAKELALYMTSKESSEIFFDYAKEIPARSDIDLEDEVYDAFIEQLEYATFMPNVPAVSAVWEPLGDALIFISNGDDAEEVLVETQDMIEDEIEIMGGGEE